MDINLLSLLWSECNDKKDVIQLLEKLLYIWN